jgi:hypothetical protein
MQRRQALRQAGLASQAVHLDTVVSALNWTDFRLAPR